MTNWIEGANGNKASVEYFGTTEAAQAALDSLKNCENCINCSDCSYCSYCSYCSECSRCSYCSRCSRCSDCSRCSYCSECSRCSYCSRCSRCSDCSRLKEVRKTEGDLSAGPPPVPVIPNIHQAIYAAASNPGSLEMGDVHTCDNTHCRGGWAIALAGKAGHVLEDFYNWELAAMLIYDASDPAFKINPARFYDTNEKALADMKQLAEKAA